MFIINTWNWFNQQEQTTAAFEVRNEIFASRKFPASLPPVLITAPSFSSLLHLLKYAVVCPVYTAISICVHSIAAAIKGYTVYWQRPTQIDYPRAQTWKGSRRTKIQASTGLCSVLVDQGGNLLHFPPSRCSPLTLAHGLLPRSSKPATLGQVLPTFSVSSGCHSKTLQRDDSSSRGLPP